MNAPKLDGFLKGRNIFENYNFKIKRDFAFEIDNLSLENQQTFVKPCNTYDYNSYLLVFGSNNAFNLGSR